MFQKDMYKILSVEINQFWHRHYAQCQFREDVNIIIGRNGTGKTTFMNILQAILSVDTELIATSDFESVTVILGSGEKRKKITATKVLNSAVALHEIKYKISNNSYLIPAHALINSRGPTFYKRKALEEAAKVRSILKNLVTLTSLSVYRLRSNDDYELRDKNGTQLISPVDFRLNELMQRLTHYQLELSEKARVISNKLQKEVLASILFSDKRSRELLSLDAYDKKKERQELIDAYKRLNAFDEDIEKKINLHVEGISKMTQEMNKQDTGKRYLDLKSFQAIIKTREIIRMSLDAEAEIGGVFAPRDRFLDIANRFITDKVFKFKNGDLEVSTSKSTLQLSHLSSGEKQLLILLTEALLQRSEEHIFLADEPELSLHIEWQRMIIPAVIELNPNAQVIAATHSPEVASKYNEAIIDMEDMVK